MKKYLKEILPAIILAFVTSFMLFIYEPITTYAANTEDYWFDFASLINLNSIAFITFGIAIIILSTIIYFLSRLIKKKCIYNIFLCIFSISLMATYIQGNYLVGALPTLDGSPIVWETYKTQYIISAILWVVIIALNILLYAKLKEKYKKAISYVSLGVFIMLTVSLITTLTTNRQIYAPKGKYVPTTENINVLSKNNNFLIFLSDMEDSVTFDKVIKENKKEYLFNDFTYFPDTLSAYPFTRESIPFILSGTWYEAETNFTEYSNNALNESELIEKLKNNNYDVNIYDQELNWTDDKSLEINNIKPINFEIIKTGFYKEELKYVLFKYLPFPLKRYSKIETLNYLACQDLNNTSYDVFESDNKIAYDKLNKIELQSKNYFQFVHIDGGHYPWDMDKDFQPVENGTYEQKIEASIKVVEKYLDRIKQSGQYDNSIILIMADHGNNGYDPVGRQNPILYIKGYNEHHESMNVSDKKVSHEDLNNTIYEELLNGKKSTELLSDIDNNRIRRFIWYKDYDKMFEQTLDGHAWETDKLTNTGNKYER